MKKISLLTLTWLTGLMPVVAQTCSTHFSVVLRDVNASMAYSTLYNLDDTSLTISFHGALKGEHDSVLLHKRLSAVEQARVCNYLSAFPVDTLKERYVDDNWMDGFKLSVQLLIGDKKKRIWVSNEYVKAIADLADVLNALIPEERFWLRVPQHSLLARVDFVRP